MTEPPASPGARVSRLGWMLLSPSSALATDAERRHARLLAAVNLTAMVLYLVCAAMTAVFEPPPANVRLPLTLGTYGVLTIGTYALSRSRHLRLATGLTLFFHWLTPATNILTSLPSEIPQPFWSCAWLVLPILLAGSLARPRTTLLVGVASFALPIVFCVWGDAPPSIAMPTAGFLFMFSGLAVVTTRHRDAVERDRSAELVARNTELLALKASLEHRVDERTSDLRKSRDDLDGVYQALRRNQESLVLSEKMASLGRLTAGIAHEMNSPVAAVRAALSEARALVDEYRQSARDPGVTPDDHEAIAAEMGSALELASKGAERAASFLRSMKGQTRDPAAREAAPFDVVASVHDALQLVAHAAVCAGSHVRFHPPEGPIEITGHPERLAQVMTNLTTNALDANASRGGGDVDVEVTREGGTVILSVVDDGPGVPEQDVKRIFDPLFSTKRVGSATGLGLTIAHDIVYGDLRGTIEVGRAPGRGAVFRVRLPVDGAALAEAAPRGEESGSLEG